jgi:hypothetical protein
LLKSIASDRYDLLIPRRAVNDVHALAARVIDLTPQEVAAVTLDIIKAPPSSGHVMPLRENEEY